MLQRLLQGLGQVNSQFHPQNKKFGVGALKPFANLKDHVGVYNSSHLLLSINLSICVPSPWA